MPSIGLAFFADSMIDSAVPRGGVANFCGAVPFRGLRNGISDVATGGAPTDNFIIASRALLV